RGAGLARAPAAGALSQIRRGASGARIHDRRDLALRLLDAADAAYLLGPVQGQLLDPLLGVARRLRRSALSAQLLRSKAVRFDAGDASQRLARARARCEPGGAHGLGDSPPTRARLTRAS